MSKPARARTRLITGLTALTAGALTAATPVLVPAAQANPAGTGLVIGEVYGGGGNSGAPYSNDFVEVHNPTSATVPLDGYAVAYFSAGGNAGGTVDLTGQIPAGRTYLVQLAAGTGSAPALPTPDASGSVNMSGTSGRVDLTQGSMLVDRVGYGTANLYEGAAPAPAASNTTSVRRSPTPGTDTDQNRADLVADAPSPTGCGADCSAVQPPEATTIEEIQGTGSASPLVGQSVTTSGVVTAAYPAGGLNALVVQTPGTGQSAGQASSAVWVAGAGATGAMASGVAVGDHVDVAGTVRESFTRTEVLTSAGGVTERSDAATPVTPLSVAWPATDAGRERLESMLVAPAGDYTVADNYPLNQYGEIGIARGTEPLYQPTDVGRPDSPEAAAQAARNTAALVTLDDGASTNFFGDAGEETPLPWLTDDPTIRVGEPVTFEHPVIVDYAFSKWRFQPTAQLTAGDDNGVLPASFGDTRTAAPASVGGDLQVASFNVLNYFTDLGVDVPGCAFYYDRTETDPVTVRDSCDARGAAEQEDLDRQQAKIVAAVNALGAEVVSLEEIENSAKFGHDRDASLARLVGALNADLGTDAWEYVPTPADAPPLAGEDFIRTAFIYKPAAVEPVGDSVIRPGGDASDDPFVNARDPLAQVFQPVGALASDRFMLVVNHFKSKGSAPAAPDPNADYGQGGWSARRVEQATALNTWVEQVQADRDVEKVYVDGDFNSYTYEDPMQALYDAGWTNLETEFDGGDTYLFDGLVGSLDHGLANDAALASTTGATVWNINSVESVALEYSRHNYNVTDFYAPTPYRSSDHDPIVFGIDTTPDLPDTTMQVSVGPKNIKVGKTRPVVDVTLTREDGAVVSDGTVTVRHDGEVVGSADVTSGGNGSVRITLPPFRSIGEQTLTVSYDGGSSDPVVRDVTVSVRR